jgi:hypothetical protein
LIKKLLKRLLKNILKAMELQGKVFASLAGVNLNPKATQFKSQKQSSNGSSKRQKRKATKSSSRQTTKATSGTKLRPSSRIKETAKLQSHSTMIKLGVTLPVAGEPSKSEDKKRMTSLESKTLYFHPRGYIV